MVDYYIEGKKKKAGLKETDTVEKLLKELHINPETVLVRIGKEIVTKEKKLKGRVEIIPVFSGE
jgi:sulfur carrier protein ThiS